jgi:hypothetical protein
MLLRSLIVSIVVDYFGALPTSRLEIARGQAACSNWHESYLKRLVYPHVSVKSFCPRNALNHIARIGCLSLLVAENVGVTAIEDGQGAASEQLTESCAQFDLSRKRVSQ